MKSKPNRFPRAWGFLGGLSGMMVVLILWVWLDRDSTKPAGRLGGDPQSESAKGLVVTSREETVASPYSREQIRQRAFRLNFPGQDPPAISAEHSPLGEGLNSSEQRGQDDVEQLERLLTQYLTVFKTYPIGNNAEITSVLCGMNPRGLAYLPMDHPAINESGELVDRWGSPIFFHQVSGTRMEVISAGPDGQMGTADDIGRLDLEGLPNGSETVP